MMKHIPLLLIALSLTCAAQQPFDWPFQPGDRVMIGGQLIQFQETAFSGHIPESTPYDTAYTDTFFMNYTRGGLPFLWSQGETAWPWQHITSVGISADGILTFRIEQESLDFLPSRPPAEDTLWLYRHESNPGIVRYCTNTRRFDTTMYGNTAQAFATDVYSADGTFIYRATFADGFWLVLIERPNRTPEPVTGFIINGREENFPSYTLEHPYFCPDLYYRYTGHGQSSIQNGWNIDFNYSLRDTLIQGVQYFLADGTTPTLAGPFVPSNPIRSVGNETRIWNGTADEVLPPLVYQVGDTLGDKWLVSVDTVDYLGTRLRFTTDGTYPIIDAPSVSQVFYSGVGEYSYSSFLDIMLPSTEYTLAEFLPCIVGVEAIPALPSWQAVVYPSPAREYITVSIQHAATAAPLSGVLYITDELGHAVLSQQWDAVTERSSLTLPVAGFAPGVYYYRLAGSSAWLAGQFVVGR